MKDDDIIEIMKEAEGNRKYFDDVVTINPTYFGKIVIVDKKTVAGVFENNKKFSEAIRKLGKAAYYGYVLEKGEGEVFNT